MEIFKFIFMQRAFVAGIMVAVILPCIGYTIVLKRLSMIGDALSHISLAGVTLGLIIGFNPIIGSVIACVFGALSIEAIRKKIPKFSELSIAIIMSAGIGLAGFLSSFNNSPANFNSYLFGSIIGISKTDFYIICALAACVLIVYIALHKKLFFMAFDERAARLAGVPVKKINFIFTIMTAVTVSIASKTVGALIASSLLVVPVACSMQLGKGYIKTLVFACVFAVTFTFLGLYLSFYADLKPGGTIVLIGVLFFTAIISFKKVAIVIGKKRAKEKIKNGGAIK